ncbi:MAG: ammonium transporter, partial [Nitrospirae bacterium]|nr:ammonium transporter [Nitrospirota bacterium]
MKGIRILTIMVLVMIMMLSVSAGLVFAEEHKAPGIEAAAPAAQPAQAVPAPAPAPAPKIDSGDTAWMIVATALVMLMTLPGLALFYGGLTKRKDTLNTVAMSFVAFCIVSVLWVVYGYTFSFGNDIAGIIGSPAKLLLSGVGSNSISDLARTIPEYIFVVYQLTFAAITVALASGAYIERMKFSAWVLFSILWMTLAYIPVAHWVWGGGFLAKLGALDFAGGTVVHVNAGVAALVGALVLGKRREMTLIPNNLIMVVTGAGLLWFGWMGFNGGSGFSVGNAGVLAIANTLLTPACTL